MNRASEEWAILLNTGRGEPIRRCELAVYSGCTGALSASGRYHLLPTGHGGERWHASTVKAVLGRTSST